jgi:hypothetical protein
MDQTVEVLGRSLSAVGLGGDPTDDDILHVVAFQRLHDGRNVGPGDHSDSGVDFLRATSPLDFQVRQEREHLVLAVQPRPVECDRDIIWCWLS